MKQQRFRIKVIALILLAALVVFGVRGMLFVLNDSGIWIYSVLNTRNNAVNDNVSPGKILGREGDILAATDNGVRVYTNDHEARLATLHAVGDTGAFIPGGLESTKAGFLRTCNASLGDRFAKLFTGVKPQGDTLLLSLDTGLSKAVRTAFNSYETTRGHSGAAVVINWRTGRIAALVSLPAADPASPDSHDPLIQAHEPYLNRVTEKLYPADFLTDIIALAAGENADTARTLETAGNFGFHALPIMRDLAPAVSHFLPADAGATSASAQATPLHAALIAAAIANNGVMPEPVLIDRIRADDGADRAIFEPETLLTVCTPDRLETLRQFFRNGAHTPGMEEIMHITTLDPYGTAYTSASQRDGITERHGWFAGYNAQPDLPFAVCVIVEGLSDTASAETSAALIARDIFNYIKYHPEAVGKAD